MQVPIHVVPRLKFCGMTREDDVEAAVACGADAIGLNFFPGSKRFIELPRAERLCAIASGRIQRVGVFVNAEPQFVAQIVERCPLDVVQLHGDESPDWIERFREIGPVDMPPIIRALPYRGSIDDDSIVRWAKLVPQEPRSVVALLIDAHDPIQHGGTGRTVRWDLLFPRPLSFATSQNDSQVRFAPLILAGGIHEDNVASAIEIAQPDGVDLASGIESAPGVKDPVRMRQVATVVQHYFATRPSASSRSVQPTDSSAQIR